MDDLIELVARALAVPSDAEAWDSSWEWYTDDAQSVLDAINRENVVVPRVATEEIEAAAEHAWRRNNIAQDSNPERAIYEAMLRASPYYVESEG